MRSQANAAVARFVYAHGLPFRVAEDKYFIAMVEAVGRAGPEWTAPKRQKLRSTLLADVKKTIREDMKSQRRGGEENGGVGVARSGDSDATVSCEGSPEGKSEQAPAENTNMEVDRGGVEHDQEVKVEQEGREVEGSGKGNGERQEDELREGKEALHDVGGSREEVKEQEGAPL